MVMVLSRGPHTRRATCGAWNRAARGRVVSGRPLRAGGRGGRVCRPHGRDADCLARVGVTASGASKAFGRQSASLLMLPVSREVMEGKPANPAGTALFSRVGPSDFCPASEQFICSERLCISGG